MREPKSSRKPNRARNSHWRDGDRTVPGWDPGRFPQLGRGGRLIHARIGVFATPVARRGARTHRRPALSGDGGRADGQWSGNFRRFGVSSDGGSRPESNRPGPVYRTAFAGDAVDGETSCRFAEAVPFRRLHRRRCRRPSPGSRSVRRAGRGRSVEIARRARGPGSGLRALCENAGHRDLWSRGRLP